MVFHNVTLLQRMTIKPFTSKLKLLGFPKKKKTFTNWKPRSGSPLCNTVPSGLRNNDRNIVSGAWYMRKLYSWTNETSLYTRQYPELLIWPYYAFIAYCGPRSASMASTSRKMFYNSAPFIAIAYIRTPWTSHHAKAIAEPHRSLFPRIAILLYSTSS